MKIKGKIKKVVNRSVLCLILCVTIAFSFCSVTFATDIPSGLTPVEDLPITDGMQEWIQNWCEQDPNGYLWVYRCNRGSYYRWILCWCGADTSIYFNNHTQIYASSLTGFDGLTWDSDGIVVVNWPPSYYPTSAGNTEIDGVVYFPFHPPIPLEGSDDVFYCSADFLDNGGSCYPNLDLSSYLPARYHFLVNKHSSDNLVDIEVDFDIDSYDSYITFWGYNEYGGISHTYFRPDYLYSLYDNPYSSFSVDMTAVLTYYNCKEFHVSSVEMVGWSDGNHEWVSVNWDFGLPSNLPDNPPDSEYHYSTFYNEYYNYSSENGSSVSFGFVNLVSYLESSNPRVLYFWDLEGTLIQPYVFSYILLPDTFTYSMASEVLDSLCLSYDIIIVGCDAQIFDAVYGSGSYSDFNSSVSSVYSFNSWYSSHAPLGDVLPWEMRDMNDPLLHDPNLLTPHKCGCYYTSSFYFKSVGFLLGDNNQYLLELESRLLGEDGFAQTLFTAMKSQYELDHTFYEDMSDYMFRLTYFTESYLMREYLPSLFSELQLQTDWLESIDGKLDDIRDAITDVGGEDYDNDLGEPWLTFYRFFKSVFIRSLGMLDSFKSTASVFIDSDSDAVGLDFYLDDDYQQYLPLISNSLSPTPTPIPIPTLFP